MAAGGKLLAGQLKAQSLVAVAGAEEERLAGEVGDRRTEAELQHGGQRAGAIGLAGAVVGVVENDGLHAAARRQRRGVEHHRGGARAQEAQLAPVARHGEQGGHAPWLAICRRQATPVAYGSAHEGRQQLGPIDAPPRALGVAAQTF
jgi:hypothetical protein